MTSNIGLKKRKIVTLGFALIMFSVLSVTVVLPQIAARPNIPAVWIVLPLVAAEILGLVYLTVLLRNSRRSKTAE